MLVLVLMLVVLGRLLFRGFGLRRRGATGVGLLLFGGLLCRLVDTLNDMLARLELSFEAQRRFTADASHELRSPLSRLRTEIELALRRPRGAAEYEATLRSCMEEAERLTLLVEELLVLARLDAGQERGPTETVCLPLADWGSARLLSANNLHPTRNMAQRPGF